MKATQLLENERQIRAVVLSLPSGTVSAEALWTVHDRGRYLWMLKDGHFLLRDQQDLQLGDASLELKPSLQFQGPLLWLEMDPAQDLVATDSREPVGSKPQTGTAPSPATASAWVTTDEVKSYAQPDIVLRIVRRTTGQVMLSSRTRTTVHLPINSEGLVETLRGKGHEWVLNLNYFKGGNRVIGKPGLDVRSIGGVRLGSGDSGHHLQSRQQPLDGGHVDRWQASVECRKAANPDLAAPDHGAQRTSGCPGDSSRNARNQFLFSAQL